MHAFDDDDMDDDTDTFQDMDTRECVGGGTRRGTRTRALTFIFGGTLPLLTTTWCTTDILSSPRSFVQGGAVGMVRPVGEVRGEKG